MYNHTVWHTAAESVNDVSIDVGWWHVEESQRVSEFDQNQKIRGFQLLTASKTQTSQCARKVRANTLQVVAVAVGVVRFQHLEARQQFDAPQVRGAGVVDFQSRQLRRESGNVLDGGEEPQRASADVELSKTLRIRGAVDELAQVSAADSQPFDAVRQRPQSVLQQRHFAQFHL